MSVDQIAAGIASFWKYTDASTLKKDKTLECDVVVVGTGAGGALAASELAKNGFRVIMVEEGPLKYKPDFKMLEEKAYPELYQESMARVTEDGGISILQGRNVGGSSTVNWTTCFRTPETTLAHWQNKYGVIGSTQKELNRTFKTVEKIYNINEWKVGPNANNSKLKEGCEKLGINFSTPQRNVEACANLGYCGMGCPVNAKKGSLVVSVVEAMKFGAELISHTRAEKLIHEDGKISALSCVAMQGHSSKPSGVKISIKAKHFVLACGSIGTPALVLRSDLDDSNDLVGKRTFLHPVAGVAAIHDQKIDPFYGAPQSIYSDDFLTDNPTSDPIGYKLECAPLHPILSSTVLQGHGKRHSSQMKKLPYTSNIIALLRDGFHEDSEGGEVFLKSDGTPGLRYDFNDYMWDGVKRAYLTMSEIMFASGAKWVTPIHAMTNGYSSWDEAKKNIPDLSYKMLDARLFSAHVMGGMPFGEDEDLTVCDSYGNYREAENLTILDGSIFPTSVGANPQVSVFAFALRNTRELIKSLRKNR